MTIDELREQIDGVDQDLVALLERREELVKDIAALKKTTQKSIEDSGREAEIKKKIHEYTETLGLDETYVQQIFDIVIAHSKKVQQTIVEDK